VPMVGGERGRGRGNTVRVNVIQIEGRNNADSGPDMEVENPKLPGLSSEQWKSLLNMLNNQKSSTNKRMISK